MKITRLFAIVAALAGLLTASAYSVHAASSGNLPASHPEALEEGRVSCSECHEDQLKGVLKPFANFNHSTQFILNHKFYAGQNDQLCSTCHKRSFCNDCHVSKESMKPALKYGDRPDRLIPHRGDYITHHKIDGKMDPGSCYKCHGRANNEKCMGCHH